MNKINGRLKFLYRKNKLLTPTLRRMLCNAIIQPHFDYDSSPWHLNLNEKPKKKIQIAKNKCIWFCLKLDKRHHISSKEFEAINWLPVNKRVHQCMNARTFKFSNFMPLNVEQNQEITLASLRFLFGKVTWGRMVFNKLVLFME